jgi:3-hydroxyacyl-[acyl-carrier-protein] dehydratase
MPPLDIQQILRMLPHRYPMQLVDRIEELTTDSVVGIKNVTANEPQFTGHFPGFPVMPGVMILEAMAQVGGILIGNVAPQTRGKIMFLASIEEAKFRKPVIPGDQLRIEMKIDRLKTTVAKMKGTASVDGQIVAEATVMCKLTDHVFDAAAAQLQPA